MEEVLQERINKYFDKVYDVYTADDTEFSIING